MQETEEMWVQSLGQENSLEEDMATHSSILAWRIPWTEEPGGLQSTRSQKSHTQIEWLSMHRHSAPRLSGLKPQIFIPSVSKKWRPLISDAVGELRTGWGSGFSPLAQIPFPPVAEVGFLWTSLWCPWELPTMFCWPACHGGQLGSGAGEALHAL